MLAFKKPDFAKAKEFFKPYAAKAQEFAAKHFNADAFGFDTRRPADAFGAYANQLEKTLKVQPVAKKVEALLALGASAQITFGALSAKANRGAARGVFAGAMAVVALAASVALAPFVIPALWVPLTAFSLVGIAMSGVTGILEFRTRHQIDIDTHTLTRQINAEVAGIAASSPLEAAQSERFKKSEKSQFNAAATPYQAEAFKELKARVEKYHAIATSQRLEANHVI